MFEMWVLESCCPACKSLTVAYASTWHGSSRHPGSHSQDLHKPAAALLILHSGQAKAKEAKWRLLAPRAPAKESGAGVDRSHREVARNEAGRWGGAALSRICLHPAASALPAAAAPAAPTQRWHFHQHRSPPTDRPWTCTLVYVTSPMGPGISQLPEIDAVRINVLLAFTAGKWRGS